MTPSTSDQLLDLIRQYRLLDAGRLRQLTEGTSSPPADARSLARDLVRRQWLTPWQANQVMLGRAHELLLGSYLLLEKLGEGGMGQVFKARNWKLDRVVALKLIRPDRLDNAEAMRRFQREIRVASQLDHPNVVKAVDADEVNGNYLFVMEYADGVPLNRVVRERGPLPVTEACGYVRQAAAGLQHAHERGLVHRDVKPGNLMLVGDVVKLLDLGLACTAADAGDDSSTLTREGTVMGTPDYMAPEQSLDSRNADVRSDLYSLGCTLYFLLTAKVPFPGGSYTEKLMKHQMRQPELVESLRPDVPPGVAAVVRKLMAKDPAHRYATPAELVHALDKLLLTESSPGSQRRRRRPPSRATRLAVAGLITLVVVGLGLYLWSQAAFIPQPNQTPPETPRPSAGFPLGPVDDAGIEAVSRLPAAEQVEAVRRKLMELNPRFDGVVKSEIAGSKVVRLEFSTDAVTDISPVAALKSLETLLCSGTNVGGGQLADLRPVRGLRLTRLECWRTEVRDLSPLQGMPLNALNITSTKVADLTPMTGMPIQQFWCGGTPVADLSPLRDAQRLVAVRCDRTKVTDLSPLRATPLAVISFRDTKVADLSPLLEVPLKEVSYDYNPWRDEELLRSAKTLTTINERPAAEFWKAEDQKRDDFEAWLAKVKAVEDPEQRARAVGEKLKERNPGYDGDVRWEIEEGRVVMFRLVGDDVTDLSPVRALTDVTRLFCNGTKAGKRQLADLWPLKGLPLRELWAYSTQVEDLSPLRGMRLTLLHLDNTPVENLKPLEGMSLKHLFLAGTRVSDLTPLKGMNLRLVDVSGTRVTDYSPLRESRILETINGKPAAKFWDELEKK